MHLAGARSVAPLFARTPEALPACAAARCSVDWSSRRFADCTVCSAATQPRARRLLCTAAAPSAVGVTAEGPSATTEERTAIGSSLWQRFSQAATGEWEGVTVTFGPAGADGIAEPQELPPRYVPNDFACAFCKSHRSTPGHNAG